MAKIREMRPSNKYQKLCSLIGPLPVGTASFAQVVIFNTSYSSLKIREEGHPPPIVSIGRLSFSGVWKGLMECSWLIYVSVTYEKEEFTILSVFRMLKTD